MMKSKLVSMVLVLLIAVVSQASTIVWVSDGVDSDLDGVVNDQGFIDLLTGAGHSVTYATGYDTLDATKTATLNAADLVIVGRGTNSGAYSTDAAEVAVWNGITAPILQTNAWLTRNTRWGWLDSGSVYQKIGTDDTTYKLEVIDPTSSAFDGIDLSNIDPLAIDEGNPVVAASVFWEYVGITEPGGTGNLVATYDHPSNPGIERAIIVTWAAGGEFYDGDPVVANRAMYLVGSRNGYAERVGDGGFDVLNETGQQMFLNMVQTTMGIPEPATMVLLSLGGLLALRKKR